jgi:hypothetical protein
MDWGLTHTQGWTVDQSISAAMPPVAVLLEPELLQQIKDAAAHGASVAAWVRQALRQVTIEDFPGSWRAGVAGVRSHESGCYQRRFMLRLDEETSKKLDTLTRGFDRPAAEVIRHLIAKAKAEDFPLSWQVLAGDDR